MTLTPSSPSSPAPITTPKQNRLREKAEEINLVLLQPNVDLWKLRELAITKGGLVNDTIRRRAWPKLVGLSSHNNNPDDVRSGGGESHKTTSSASTNTDNQVLLLRSKNHNNPKKGTSPNRVTNFGQYDTENQRRNLNPNTGGVFDLHDTAGTAADAYDSAVAAASAANTAKGNDDNDNSSLASLDSLEPSNVVACADADQIERDVTRCTWHLLTGGQRTRRRLMLNKHRKKISTILRQKQRRLGDLINLTLAVSERGIVVSPPPPRGEDNNNTPPHQDDEDRLCYYQGYHDVASIFLAALGGASTKGLVPSSSTTSKEQQQHSSSTATAAAQAASMGLDLSSKVLYQVSLSHFREPMRANFLQLQTTLKMVLMPLLNVMDPELHSHLWGCGMEPFFALSWLLTWFSHDIRDTVLVKRLFDFFLVSHPLMPIYLSVAMLCHPSNRKEILATPCEFAELHNVLQGLPKNSSMVGWKWSVGVDGYVSDDEQVGEDGETSISLDSDMASHPSGSGGGGGSNRGQQSSLRSGDGGGIMRREDLILSEGQAHVVSMGIPAHVPFQELIDTAISFIGRVPPRELRSIAVRYYDEQDVQPILELYPSITFFQQIPSWALAATAKADWVLKQRARDRRALTELPNRNNNSTNNNSTTSRTATDNSTSEATTCWTSEMVAKKAKDLKYPKAMIAQGFGAGEQAIARQHKRRKLLMIGGAATVALFAIGVGVAMQSRGPYLAGANDSGTDGSGSNDFDTQREEAVSYVKSTKMPTWQRRRKSRGSAASSECADTGSSSSALSNVDRDVGSTNDSLIQAYFQRYVMRELQLVYAKIRLVMGTLAALSDTIQDPNFSDNLQATLSQMTQSVVSVQDPEVRAAIHKGVAKRAAQATQAVGGFAQNVGGIATDVFKWTAGQARSHLGGNNFEQLGLL